MEEWRPVVGWEDRYEVSDTGLVRSLFRNLYLKPYTDVDGYPVVTLARAGRTRNRKVSRLVAEAFLPNPMGLPLVRHLNDIKTDNHRGNLRWGTARDNAQDAIRNGRNARLSRSTCPQGHTYPPRREGSRGRKCLLCERTRDAERRRTVKGGEPPRHGNLNAYTRYQCRCPECSQVWSDYQKSRRGVK